MHGWNAEGLRYLDSVVKLMEETGFARWLEGTIADVWRTNMDRYEPAVLGDTPRSFGILSSDNIQQRTLRAARAGEGPWKDGQWAARHPGGALLIKAGGMQIHIVKAPRSGSRTPVWQEDFTWTAKSNARLNAAWRNSAQSRDPQAPMVGQHVLFEFDHFDSVPEPSTFTDIFVVWNGEENTGLTAGWVGIPVLGPNPWLAVRPVWRDETNSVMNDIPQSAGDPSGASNFDALQEPKPVLRLKPVVAKLINEH